MRKRASSKKGEEEEYGSRRNGKFTSHLIMTSTAGGIESRKLLFVLTWLLLAILSNCIVLAYIHDIVGREALPDIVFSMVPELVWTLKIGDMITTICSISFFAVLFFHKNRLIILQRFSFILGSSRSALIDDPIFPAFLYTMRMLSLLSTQLPSAYVDNNKRCRGRINHTSQEWNVFAWRALSQAAKLGFQDMDGEMLCGDLLFSGHTMVMVLTSLSISYYLPDSLRPLRYIPRVLSWIGMICMVISRTHYTVDVLFAYWLSTAVFSIYHAFCEIDLADRKLSVLYRLWVMRTVNWLEVDITPGRLENRFEFPLFVRFYKWWTSPSSHHYCTECQRMLRKRITEADGFFRIYYSVNSTKAEGRPYEVHRLLKFNPTFKDISVG
uniref:Sphingomyelin synthase-like domain-containing protein n=1 Tax=Setaria digitata TaxID=48799 RepID=A0A915Q2E2_9BILA